MDSNSNNSSELNWPKLEIDENETPKRDTRLVWSAEATKKLIELLEKDCKELWDSKHPTYKHRMVRQGKLEYLADIFSTNTMEINRKIHNLRTQFNNELRKIKRRQVPVGSGEGSGAGGGSTWEHFEALSFLMRAPSAAAAADPLYVDGVNLALAEFQADEEEEFGAAARAHSANTTTFMSSTGLRVAASAPPPLPASAHPMMWPEEPVPRPGPGLNADECQIFGDFVASELRMLRSNESRKRLKRMIQKAILQIGEEEDCNGMHE